jgi:hypothetical protein
MKRRVRGQSMVELALILPFLVLITIGTMELGYYIYTYSELENATRRASEWASKTPPWTVQSCDDVMSPATRPGGCTAATGAETRDECASLIKQNALDGVVMSRLQAQNITIAYPTGSQRKVGDQVQVQLTYRGQWLSPIGRRFFGNALNFSFTSRRTILSVDAPDGRNYDCRTK